MASGTVNKWARGWLAEVDEARKALDRIARIQELRASLPALVGNPLGSADVRSEEGISQVVDNVSEAEGAVSSSTYDWACDVLVLFDMMEEINRPLLRGQLLSGLDIAYMRYRLGATDSEIGRAFHSGKFAIHEDLNAFVDYLDRLGPMRAFHADVDEMMKEMVGSGAGMTDVVEPEDAD